MSHPPEHKLRWYQYSLRSLFILTTLVALVCSWYAVQMQEAAKRPLGSVAPEACLKQHLGLTVPESARNVKCSVEAIMVKWVYARLDVPRNDLPGLLLQAPLNRLPPPSRNAELLRQLQVSASDIPWWQKSADGAIAVSQSRWRKSGESSDWECSLSLCVEEETDRVIVYVQYYEEPVSKGR